MNIFEQNQALVKIAHSVNDDNKINYKWYNFIINNNLINIQCLICQEFIHEAFMEFNSKFMDYDKINTHGQKHLSLIAII